MPIIQFPLQKKNNLHCVALSKTFMEKQNQDWLSKCDEQGVVPVHQSSIPKTLFQKSIRIVEPKIILIFTSFN